MRVCLLNIPWRKNNRYGVRAGSRWPFTSKPEDGGYIKYIPFPFFLAYSVSLLKSRGKDAVLIDAIARDLDEKSFLYEVLEEHSSLLVAETSTPSFENDIDILFKVKQNNPGSRLALCGPHASVYASEILAGYDFIDYVFIGEYEHTLLDLTGHFDTGRDLESVPGLAYRSRSGVQVNRKRPAAASLDDLPWPEREEKYIYNYNDGFAGLPVPNVQMCSSRGCPFRCTFCLWPQVLYSKGAYRKRKPLNVVKEMSWLVKNFAFKAVYFDDDIFNLDKKHVSDICREIRMNDIKIPWAAMGRADLMDEKLLGLMAGSGLYALKYGIESANPSVLRRCRKKMNLQYALKMIKYTKKIGVKTHLTFCLGLPGETKRSIQDTADFILAANPDSLQFSFATPFPGTELFEYLRRKKITFPSSWSEYDGNNRYFGAEKIMEGFDLERFKHDLGCHFNL
ncbi:MAG: radical SAM protein [Candidatus Omnitrophica bacterium]|nr:radical SAM protein [Candidatus Omnitrophota bacterium]